MISKSILSSLRDSSLSSQSFYPNINKLALLFLLAWFNSSFCFSQQEGFQVVQGARIGVKLENLEIWNRDGYLIELENEINLETYKKAIVSFDRLNEFRRAEENHRISINGGVGYIIVLSWKELGVSDGKDGQFARRNLNFVMNDNAQLKEQFLD